jgi:hypothetical protein
MNRKVVFLDPVSPRGHVSLNRFYIKSFLNQTEELVVSDELTHFYSDICEVKTIKGRFLRKGRTFHFFYTLMVSLNTLFRHSFKKNHSIVLLSYDITNLFIISHLAKILKIELIVFEHNTLPGSSIFKKTLQKICSNHVLRFCYTPRAKKEYISLNNKAVVIPHPLIKEEAVFSKNKKLDKLINQYEYVVFCPSASADITKLLVHTKAQPQALFIVKSNQNIDFPNCYTSTFFEEYDWIMEVSDFVYLPINFSGRVSGPMYGAILHSCKVVVDRNDFGKEAHKQFEGMIQYSDEPWIKNQVTFNVSLYNDGIVKKIKKYLFK